MKISDLGGHSGCCIQLIETDDNHVFVRKRSSNLEYNDRLKAQAEKQKSFLTNGIKTPQILNQGFTDENLFYFDMEYIQGITLAEYMKSIEIGKIKKLVETLVENIICPSMENRKANIGAFTHKLADLRNKLGSMNNVIIEKALNLMEKHSWDNFLETPCHGDLTLENIIIKDNELYVIDFLDSFYDCWLMDISTLMQDVQTLWSFRYSKQISNNVLIRLIIFRDILMDTVKEMIGNQYIEVYYALLLKLIRIYPYVNDERTYQFLNEKTESIIEIINEENAICER